MVHKFRTYFSRIKTEGLRIYPRLVEVSCSPAHRRRRTDGSDYFGTICARRFRVVVARSMAQDDAAENMSRKVFPGNSLSYVGVTVSSPEAGMTLTVVKSFLSHCCRDRQRVVTPIPRCICGHSRSRVACVPD